MANAFQTTGFSPGNIREALGTHYTTPVGSMANSQEPLEPGAQLTRKQLYQREYYRKNREKLLEAQKMRDNAAPETKKQRDHESYIRNRDERRALQKRYAKAHRKEISARERLRYQEMSKDAKEQQNRWNRECRRRLRLEVIAAYGSACACCGELEEAFLEAHHKNGGGNQHRRELGSNAKLYGWLKRNGWPKEFGLLCSNCNKAEYNRGICPHRLARQQQTGSIN